MTEEALIFVCDEAACREDPMFYEIFAMDDRWDIIRSIIKAVRDADTVSRDPVGDREMGDWQPIETAPRSSGAEVIISGRYPNGLTYVETAYWDPRGFWSGRRLDPPTHWMPLPLPPSHRADIDVGTEIG